MVSQLGLTSTSLNDPFMVLHARRVPSPSTCRALFHHERGTEMLSGLIIIGLIISYLPQHYRIIVNKTSEGFSPFFLLLGASSSASSLLNIVSLQWGQVGCCKYLEAAECFESVLGIAQVFFQWFCFNLIFILYLVFFPSSEKYVRSLSIESGPIPPVPSLASYLPSLLPPSAKRTRTSSTSSSASSNSSINPLLILLPGQVRHSSIILSPSYRLALSLFALTMLHLFLTTGTTFILLYTLPGLPKEGSPPAGGGGGKEHPSETAVRVWATTLGILSVLLACVQYVPQILLTLRRRLVGSLSIPMMFLQTPGSFVFVYTLAVRPGVNWTAWATYLVTGILQGSLLVMCWGWKAQQKKLEIDDWGNSILPDREESQARPGERTSLLWDDEN